MGGDSTGEAPGGELSPLLAAALSYAARGWPVFPCNPKNKQPLLASKKDEQNKPIRGTGGVSAASTDATQIRAWWQKWPKALVGLATGHPTIDAGGLRLFVVDFDPRADDSTGEVWTLDQLKRDFEQMIGCALPHSLAALTPSDGVHLYLLQDNGEPVRNSASKFTEHVDVRGLGGYVIAPPGTMADDAIKGQGGLRYRWHRKEPIGGIARAPEQLLGMLRDRSRKAGAVPSRQPDGAIPSTRSAPMSTDDAVRKYAMAALDGELQAVRSAGSGARNHQLNTSAFNVATLVAAGALDATLARLSLEQAARDNPGNDDDRQLSATIDSGWSAGLNQPRDLKEVASNSRSREHRQRGRGNSPHAPRPLSSASNGSQSSQAGGRPEEVSERGRGGEGDAQLTRTCAFHPLTDLGNLERFLDRFGADFLYVEAWGWLAWDGRRWDREMAVPLLARAVQRTVRLIQQEADYIRASGVPFPDEDELRRLMSSDDDDDSTERKAKIKSLLRQRMVARRVSDHGGERLDSIIQIKSNGEIILYSDKLAAWGRTSESSGHISCLSKPDLAGARLAALTGEFDQEPLALNVENGTIVFARPDRGFEAGWSIRDHRREDRMTKICEVAHDAKATCPKFDAFLAKVQPDVEMRAFLDVWGGYNALGLADAQKMALFYGEGSNGKGVWINTIAHILGDYAWATGIETFIDQGRYRKGSDASPDLAALAGRRMIYANEPEEHSKFSDGLIKELTSDEPKGGVRELMKPPFELQITFSNTVSANTLPKIGTDHGIQRRVQVVPWNVTISDAEADPLLKSKLKAEASGILNRMIAGAVQYLQSGLPTPEAVKEATREYQQENDLLGKFVELCVARVPGETVGARPFHRVFAAWQMWAGQLPQSGKPWSEKYLHSQMRKKKFDDTKSGNKKWLNIALRFDASHFCDHDNDGKIVRTVETDLPPPRTFEGEIGRDGKPRIADPPSTPPPYLQDDDDDVPFG